MSINLIIAVIIGSAFNTLVMLYCRKFRDIPKFKICVLSILGTLCGIVSVKLMCFVEQGSIEGQSFFGAVFFIPFFMIPVSSLLKEKYNTIMDLCAPSVTLMLAMMKVMCKINGCCRGKVLFSNEAGESVRFPSQIAEFVLALLLTVIIILIIKREDNAGFVYPAMMILYGVNRGIMNLWRDTSPNVLFLPFGAFWAIWAIVCGFLWIEYLCHLPFTMRRFEKKVY